MSSEKFYKLATYFLSITFAIFLIQGINGTSSFAKTRTKASTCTTIQYADRNLVSDPEIALCIAKLENEGFTIVDIVPIVQQKNGSSTAVFYLVRGEK